jgi:peptidyl-prolyl cis-trans isomerase C
MNVVRAFMSNPTNTVRAGSAALLLAIMLGATGSAFGESPSTDPLLAVVNGTEIRESDLRLQDEFIGRNLPAEDPQERRAALMRILTDTILLSQEAKARNIADEPDLQRRMTLARNQGLTIELMAKVSQDAVTDEAIRKTYEEVVVKSVKNDPELHLRHMVFFIHEPKDDAAVKAAEQKAQAALDRVKKGEDFAAVAADVSEAPNAKNVGGDFEWRTRNEMGKEYAEVAFTLKKGEPSALIKTAVGWHIIVVEDEPRTRKPPELEKIRDRVASVVANIARIKVMDEVHAKAKIERMDQPDAAAAKPQN